MKVTASGLFRTMYLHKVGEATLSEMEGTFTPTWNGLHINKNAGTVTICWTRQDLTLNGSYGFQMALSRGDIAKLFVETMGNLPMAEVVKLLAATKGTVTAEEASTAA